MSKVTVVEDQGVPDPPPMRWFKVQHFSVDVMDAVTMVEAHSVTFDNSVLLFQVWQRTPDGLGYQQFVRRAFREWYNMEEVLMPAMSVSVS